MGIEPTGSTGSPVTNTWVWDPTNGTGQLGSKSNDVFSETYTYDADSKLTYYYSQITVSGVLAAGYSHDIAYNSAGQVDWIKYGSLQIDRDYDSRGRLTALKAGSNTVHEYIMEDAYGNSTQERLFNDSLRTNRTFDASTGRLNTIQTGTPSTPKSIQDLETTWRSNGALYKRYDRRGTSSTGDDLVDTYSYDTIERLTQQATSGGTSRTKTYTYDAYGNLHTKDSNISGDLDVGSYSYGVSAKPHRLTSLVIDGISNTLSYDNNGNITRYNASSGDDTYIDFDSRNNVEKITIGSSSTTSTPTARDEFWYGPDGNRVLGRESWMSGGTLYSAVTSYIGAFEEIRPASSSGYSLFRRYQVSPNVQWVWRQTSGGSTASFWRFMHRDHLGSVEAVSYAGGSIINDLSYDPFGSRRNSDWASDISPTEFNQLLGVDNEDENSPRGYTDHEMLNRTGFIHMNGRVYDPRIGRFVSPDPIVQSPSFSQSYNRYAYVHNSPLSYSDPSGFESDPLEDPRPVEAIQSTVDEEYFREFESPLNRVIREEVGPLANELADPNSAACLYYKCPPGDSGVLFNPVVGVFVPIEGGRDGEFGRRMFVEAMSGVALGASVVAGAVTVVVVNGGRLAVLANASIFANQGGEGVPPNIAKVATNVDDLIAKSKPGRKTRGVTTQFVREGGFEQANRNFDSLGPLDVRSINTLFGPGRAGVLPDGRRVVVRPGGSGNSPPTLEIQDGIDRIKFRFRE